MTITETPAPKCPACKGHRLSEGKPEGRHDPFKHYLCLKCLNVFRILQPEPEPEKQEAPK